MNKYKVGDILEYWSRDYPEDDALYIVVGYDNTSNCSKKKCAACKRSRPKYIVRDIKTGFTISMSKRSVEMIGEACEPGIEGWRKVG